MFTIKLAKIQHLLVRKGIVMPNFQIKKTEIQAF